MSVLTESTANKKQFISNVLLLTNKRINMVGKHAAGAINNYLRQRTQGKHRELFTVRLYLRSFNFEKDFTYAENNPAIEVRSNMRYNAEDPVLLRYMEVVKKLNAGMERSTLADAKFVHEEVRKFASEHFGTSGKTFQNATTSLTSIVAVSVLEFPPPNEDAVISGDSGAEIVNEIRQELVHDLRNLVDAISVDHRFRVGQMPVQFSVSSGEIEPQEYVQNVFLIGIKWKKTPTTTQETESYYGYGDERGQDKEKAINNNLEMMRFHRTMETQAVQTHIKLLANNIQAASAMAGSTPQDVIKSLRDSLAAEAEGEKNE